MLLIALRQCREQGLRHMHTEAVFNVLSARRDLISCVSLSLWTIGQALATRAPLPQFLPSPRAALRELTMALQRELEVGSLAAGSGSGEPSGSAGSSDAYHALMRAGDLQWQARPSYHRRRSDIPLHESDRKGSPDRSGMSTPVRRTPAVPNTAPATGRHPHWPSSDVDFDRYASSRAKRAESDHHGRDHDSRSRSPMSPLAKLSQVADGNPGSEKSASEAKEDAKGATRDAHTSNSPAEAATPSTPRRRKVNYAYFWIFAEHSLLSALIDELELLLEETRDLCGEVTFITTEYLSPSDALAERARDPHRGAEGMDSEQNTLMHRHAYPYPYESYHNTTMGAHSEHGLTHLQSVALQEALALRGVGMEAGTGPATASASMPRRRDGEVLGTTLGAQASAMSTAGAEPAATEGEVLRPEAIAEEGRTTEAEGKTSQEASLKQVTDAPPQEQSSNIPGNATSTADSAASSAPRQGRPSGGSTLRNMFDGV